MKFDLKKPEDSPPGRWRKAKTEGQEPKAQQSRLSGDITIKLNLKKILKGFFVIALLLGVFFLGRLSVPGNFTNSLDLSAAATAEETSLEAEEPAPVVEEAPVEEPVEEVPEEPVEEEKEEPIVTEYNNVVLTFTDVGVDWKETWGKISSVTYTLKNDEDGTIKPHHFTMMVEGYPVDEPGKFDVSLSSQKVKSHTSIKDSSIVYAFGGKTKGFSYNEKETGDITSVEIKLFLWDASKNLIGHGKKVFDLSG